MIDYLAFKRFLSGRLLGLVVLLGFQVIVVRLSSPVEYGRYALAVALAALLQTLTSFGLPRVAAKFLSGAGDVMTYRAARRLALAMLALRLAGFASMLVPVLMCGAFQAQALLWSGCAYALASALQADTDTAAQALRLQIASRRAAVGEPLARLALVLMLAVGGGAENAVALLWISAATSAAAAGLLIGAVLKALARGKDAPTAGGGLDWREIRRVAIGGYGGALSWLALSPAVIRLVASRILPVDAFAGFSFVQALVVSAQRYAPSFTLFTLIEPAIMADAARTGRPERLVAALSLMVKLDAVLVGAAIVGASAAGAPVILLVTHGRYGGAAIFLPWLLAAIVANASHRSYEIAAIGLGAAEALTRSLSFTLAWLAAAVLAASCLGVWPLLLCPLGDALTRLWVVQQTLSRKGAPQLIDLQGFGRVAVAAGVMSLVAVVGVQWTHGGLIADLAIGLVASVVYLAILMVARPILPEEAAILPGGAGLLKRLCAGPREASKPLRVIVLTPRGRGGVGGVDRLMDKLRPVLAHRTDASVRFMVTRGASRMASPLVTVLALVKLALASAFRRVDLVHVNLGAQGSCYRKIALLAIPRLLGTPYVLHLHGSGFASFWTDAPMFARRQIDRLFLKAAHVIVLGEAWRRLVTDRLPAAAPRTLILPNASPVFEGRRESSVDGVQLLFLGEQGPRKGSMILIEALGLLKTSTAWRAVIAGDGDGAPALAAARLLGLAGRISLPGWVGSNDVEALLATSDILVLPSFEENLPMAVIEAFAAELAVVATPVGALPDILKHGETGLVVTPGDAQGIANALGALIDDPALRRRLGAAAKAYHAEHLELGAYADQLVRIWRDAV